MTIVTTAYAVDPSVTRRQKVERKIVSRAVTALLDGGFWLAVCQGDEEEQPMTRDKRIVMRDLGECDDDRLIVYNADLTRTGWVYLVYGNDHGETVITDYTVNLEPEIAPVCAYAETL
jgi:hypothetical protein